MKSFSIVLALWAAKTLASPLEPAAGIPEDAVFQDLTWVGPLQRGGEDQQFSGNSLEDIDAQIKEINSTLSLFDGSMDFDGSIARRAANIESRTPSGHFCNIGGGKAFAVDVPQNINYLRRIPGSATMAGGSRPVCSRVSCSYNNGITWCNDNSGPVTVPWATIADYATMVLQKCTEEENIGSGNLPHYQRTVNGQQFDTRKFNVIVRREFC